jgi:hypothetical protein|tara:strand:+ start:176 stop:667 length:492 start_codon:yes stop_codon:yes gene_type:complete
MSRRRDPSYNMFMGLMNIATGTSKRMSIKRLLKLRDMLTIHANGHRIINIREFVYVRNNELNRLINVSHLRPLAQKIVMLPGGSESMSKNRVLEIQRRFVQLIESSIEADLLENHNSNNNGNNRRTTGSKKSTSTKITKTKVTKIKKSAPGTPQSKLRKKSNK